MDNLALLRAFRREPDGSWSCLEPVTVETPEGPLAVAPGEVVRFGQTRQGLDLAEYLEQLGAQFGS